MSSPSVRRPAAGDSRCRRRRSEAVIGVFMATPTCEPNDDTLGAPLDVSEPAPSAARLAAYQPIPFLTSKPCLPPGRDRGDGVHGALGPRRSLEAQEHA